MRLITVVLLQILVITNVYTTGESEENGSTDSGDDDDETQRSQPTIRINANRDHLEFTPVTPDTLPKEYAIGTKLQIITSSELAKLLVLQDKNRKFRRIPLIFSRFSFEGLSEAEATPNNHYEIQLSHCGDFCFFKLPSNTMDILFNNNDYCFRVLHSDLLSTAHRVVFIIGADTLTLPQLKMKILQNLHLINIASVQTAKEPKTQTTDAIDNPPKIQHIAAEANDDSNIDKAPIKAVADEGIDKAPVEADDKADDNPPKIPVTDTAGNTNADSGIDSFRQSDDNPPDKDSKTPHDTAQTVGDVGKSVQKADADSDEATNEAVSDEEIKSDIDSAEQSDDNPMQKTVEGADKDSKAQTDTNTESDEPLPRHIPRPPLSPLNVPKRRRMIGAATRTPTVIGINVAFETQGILISQIVSEKLLFLIQHIVAKLMPFLSPKDLIITLPVSKKLKHYESGTVSERVALVVNNARKKDKHLQQAYELQYAADEEATFGGRIVLDTTKPATDVPIKEIQFVDFMISIASLPNNANVYGISVKHWGTTGHVCFSIINVFGYDYLYGIGNKISKCILNKMHVQNVNNLNIFISNDGNKIDLNAGTGKEENLIEFELELEGNECCFIKIADKSKYHKIYKDDIVDAQNRQLVVLRANIITVVPSESLLRSKSIQISDIVYYVDTIDAFDKYEFEGGMDFSSHSKIKSLHYLLHSSKEYVSIPYGLWYLCVSWIQTNNGNDKSQIHTDKCSDNVYFNANFLLSSDKIKLSNELNKESESVISKLDTFGFLSLQLVHLQSLMQDIDKIKNKLNQQNEDEINIYHNLEVHQLASSSYKQHLKQIEIMYQKLVNKKGDSKIDKQDLENQLKIIKKRLKNQESFEEKYGDKFHKFEKNEINDQVKKRDDLMQQISISHEQIVHLQLSMKQQHEMLDSLKQQIDSIEIND